MPLAASGSPFGLLGRRAALSEMSVFLEIPVVESARRRYAARRPLCRFRIDHRARATFGFEANTKRS
jgi:hypothetical protein